MGTLLRPSLTPSHPSSPLLPASIREPSTFPSSPHLLFILSASRRSAASRVPFLEIRSCGGQIRPFAAASSSGSPFGDPDHVVDAGKGTVVDIEVVEAGGGGGGNGGGSAEEGKKIVGGGGGGMSMSQKITLAYAALVGVGGVIGFLKSGSQKSLAAGGMSALLLYFVYTQLPVRPAFASSLGLGLSGALMAVMGSRFRSSGKLFPAGEVSLVSLVMVGGYAHGILRGLHGG